MKIIDWENPEVGQYLDYTKCICMYIYITKFQLHRFPCIHIYLFIYKRHKRTSIIMHKLVSFPHKIAQNGVA